MSESFVKSVPMLDNNDLLDLEMVRFALVLNQEEAAEECRAVSDKIPPTSGLGTSNRGLTFGEMYAKDPKILLYLVSQCNACSTETRVDAFCFLAHMLNQEARVNRRVPNVRYKRIITEGLYQRYSEKMANNSEALARLESGDIVDVDIIKAEVPAVIATGSVEVVDEIDVDIVPDVPESIGSEIDAIIVCECGSKDCIEDPDVPFGNYYVCNPCGKKFKWEESHT